MWHNVCTKFGTNASKFYIGGNTDKRRRNEDVVCLLISFQKESRLRKLLKWRFRHNPHDSKTPHPRTQTFYRPLRDHLNAVHGSSCFMYAAPVAKKTIHNGILLAGLMSHSFVSNKIEGFIIKHSKGHTKIRVVFCRTLAASCS